MVVRASVVTQDDQTWKRNKSAPISHKAIHVWDSHWRIIRELNEVPSRSRIKLSFRTAISRTATTPNYKAKDTT